MTPMTLFRHMWMTNGCQIQNQHTILPLETQKSEKWLMTSPISIIIWLGATQVPHLASRSHLIRPSDFPLLSEPPAPLRTGITVTAKSPARSSLSKQHSERESGRLHSAEVFLLARTAPIDPHRHPFYRTASSCPNCWVRNVLQDSESYECFLSQLHKCRYLPRQTRRFQGSGS